MRRWKRTCASFTVYPSSLVGACLSPLPAESPPSPLCCTASSSSSRPPAPPVPRFTDESRARGHWTPHRILCTAAACSSVRASRSSRLPPSTRSSLLRDGQQLLRWPAPISPSTFSSAGLYHHRHLQADTAALHAPPALLFHLLLLRLLHPSSPSLSDAHDRLESVRLHHGC
jgi:hypothetical protein